jgi:malate dehydrogenase (oxaloacetate-decarboxylating)
LDIDGNTYLQLIQTHLKEMFPIIYTPTEGDAIENFSRLFRRPEGCFLNINDKDRIPQDLEKWSDSADIDIIVVSDGEQVDFSLSAMFTNYN